ncbi:MAG: hypothetical protein ACJAWV_001802 [Flammeovirgaceae bacterium]|jgi:hypothetical protein
MGLLDKKLTFDEQGSELTISFRWMCIQAFFLIPFCLFWNGMLIFMYTMMFSSGAPLFAFLFPLIHLSVGIGLTYYTICLFFNRTYITANRDELSVRHAPLPWIGAKTLNVSEIEQLFVKEKVSRGKNGTTVTYNLLAKMKDGKKDTKILSGSTLGDSGDVQQMENKIEAFLGIRDRAVPSEYQSDMKPTLNEVPRKKKIGYNPVDLTLQNLLKGYVLNYDFKSWEVIYEGQYDWNSGESDKIYRLSSGNNDSLLLYVDKEMGLVTPYIEEKLQSNDIQAFTMLKAENAPAELKFADKIYRKKDYSKGKFFASDSDNFTDLGQWFYVSSDSQSSLRIAQFSEGEVSVYTGRLAQAYEFTNILPSENSRDL